MRQLWGFIRWLVRGFFYPHPKWLPVGLGLWLIAGAPRDDGQVHLSGGEHAIGIAVGVALIAGLFCFWRQYIDRPRPSRRVADGI